MTRSNNGSNGTGATLGRDVIMRPTLATERVKVPEWGGEIVLRAMSAAQTMEFTQLGTAVDPSTDPGSALRLAAWVIVACWVDDAGAQVLSVGDIDDLLATQTADVINRLAEKAMRVSGLTTDMVASIASAEKNSVSSLSADSGILSPSP